MDVLRCMGKIVKEKQCQVRVEALTLLLGLQLHTDADSGRASGKALKHRRKKVKTDEVEAHMQDSSAGRTLRCQLELPLTCLGSCVCISSPTGAPTCCF